MPQIDEAQLEPHRDARARRANGTLLELDLLHTCQIQLMRLADVENVGGKESRHTAF